MRQCNRLPRGVVGGPSLGVLKVRLNEALSKLIVKDVPRGNELDDF